MTIEPQTEPEVTYKNFSFTWRVSERMLASLREWAAENYDDWSRDKPHFRTDGAMVRKFIEDHVWTAYSGWKREAENEELETKRIERADEILKYNAPFESARDALELILEEPSQIEHGKLWVALQDVVKLETEREKERERAREEEDDRIASASLKGTLDELEDSGFITNRRTVPAPPLPSPRRRRLRAASVAELKRERPPLPDGWRAWPVKRLHDWLRDWWAGTLPIKYSRMSKAELHAWVEQQA